MRLAAIACLAALTTAACATAGAERDPGAPAPLKPVDAARLYTGTWYEIGRRPMSLTDGCVAGATTYERLDERRIKVRDTCRQGSPTGKEKAVNGAGYILDPGTNSRLRVRYFVVVNWEYDVLDHAEDYSWFISADPNFTNLWIYTRDPHPSAALKAELTARATTLGYDVSRLEFPEEAAP